MITFIYLFGVLHRFQHCTGHITTGSWKGRGNQYIQFVRVLYCKLPTNYQLSHLRPCREPNPSLRGGRRECYHSAMMITKYDYSRTSIIRPLIIQILNYPTSNSLSQLYLNLLFWIFYCPTFLLSNLIVTLPRGSDNRGSTVVQGP